jgi:hypothetical protein
MTWFRSFHAGMPATAKAKLKAGWLPSGSRITPIQLGVF